MNERRRHTPKQWSRPTPTSTPSDSALRPVRTALEQILRVHQPYPALIIAGYGRMVAVNDAVEVFTEGASPELLEPPVNMPRLMLHPRGMGRRVRNLGEWGRHVIENLRARARRSPDPRLDELIAEMTGYVPHAAVGTSASPCPCGWPRRTAS